MGLLSGLIIAKLQIAPFIATLGMMMAARGIALVMTDGGVSVSVDTGVAETFRLFARSYLLRVCLLYTSKKPCNQNTLFGCRLNKVRNLP